MAIRSYNVLRLLSRSFDVTALCFYRRKGGGKQDIKGSVAALSELADVRAFPIPQEHSRSKLIWDHLRSVVSRRVYTHYAYESREYESQLRSALSSGSFDLVHMDSLDLARYLPLIHGIPVVCVHHNIESQLLRRRAAKETTALRRAYLRHQAELMEREERLKCGRVSLNVAVSDEDRLGLERLAPDGRYTVVPNGVDSEMYAPDVGSERNIVFLGGTNWFPNKDALTYFCDEVLPVLRGMGVNAPIQWIGRSSAEEQRYFRDRFDVELTGYVDDIRPLVHDAACCIVPLRVGGGTRLKIVTTWAMAKAVVSTTLGCEGLDAVDGDNILIRDTPSQFAEAIRACIVDAELRQRLGSSARATVERTYSWEVIGESMTRDYLALLEPGSATRPRRVPNRKVLGITG